MWQVEIKRDGVEFVPLLVWHNGESDPVRYSTFECAVDRARNLAIKSGNWTRLVRV